jgi:hypothetical protein
VEDLRETLKIWKEADVTENVVVCYSVNEFCMFSLRDESAADGFEWDDSANQEKGSLKSHQRFSPGKFKTRLRR